MSVIGGNAIQETAAYGRRLFTSNKMLLIQVASLHCQELQLSLLLQVR